MAFLIIHDLQIGQPNSFIFKQAILLPFFWSGRERVKGARCHMNKILYQLHNIPSLYSFIVVSLPSMLTTFYSFQTMMNHHTSFSTSASGLWISPEYPYIGASPDAIASCDCHGKFCVEIKCPWKLRDKNLSDALTEGIDLCIERSAEGQFHLKRTHPYWYQVQTQLFCTGLDFAHFILWSPTDIVIASVVKDPHFLSSHLNVLSVYFKNIVFPEILGKYYSKPRLQISENDKLYCYCRVNEEDELQLNCSNESCIYKKFHLQCCGLKRMPSIKKSWFCLSCRKIKKCQMYQLINDHQGSLCQSL